MQVGLGMASIAAANQTSSNFSVGAAIGVATVFGLLIGLAVLALAARRGGVIKRVGDFVSTTETHGVSQRSLIERALGDKQARTLAKSPFIARLRVELEVAEITLSAEQGLGLTAVATVAVAWLLVISTHSYLAIVLGALVPVAANAGVRIAADRQRRNFSEQLPDNLQVIASAMRAGQTFVGALQNVVDDAPEPSKRELRRAMTDEAIGVPLSDALTNVTERMKSEDFQHVAIVATLQRDTGGNTAEVIDLVADTVRERIEIRRMVRGLTAQGRLSGMVLSLLPVGMLLMTAVIDPGYVHPLFHTTGGLIALGVAIALTGGGGLAIRRIVDIEI